MIYLLHAERKLNASINLQNVLYVNGLGASLCIDGRIFEGVNGFVGELGMILTDTYGALNENDYWNPYRSNYFTSVYLGLPQAVKNIIGTELTHEQIFEMYNNGAENVRLSVETFLHLFALVIRNIAGFMDLSHVIIGGPMAKLNDKAFALISTYINSGIIDKMDVQILRATAGRTDLKGAFEFAMDLSFEELLGRKVVEKTLKKGDFTMENSVDDMKEHSILMKMMAKFVEIYMSGGYGWKIDYKNNAYKMMVVNALNSSMSGIKMSICMKNYCLEGLVEIVNGHVFKGIKTMFRK